MSIYIPMELDTNHPDIDTNAVEPVVEQIYQLRIKFNTNVTFDAQVTNTTTINDLSKMCVLDCCKLNAPISAVPAGLINKCKLVFKGKIISQQTSTIVSIDGIIGSPTPIFCIMAPLSAAEIDSIKQNMGPSDEDLIRLLASDSLRNCLNKPSNFAHLSHLIGVEYVVSQSQIDALLGSESILNYIKQPSNFKQLTDWSDMGGQMDTIISTSSAGVTLSNFTNAEFAFQHTLNEVISMGFADNEMTRNVVLMFKGNTADVVNHLVSM